MAVKIRLKRIGKKRAPFYRIVVMDARTKRDGRAIEEIGKYNPKAEPSFIHVETDRAQYWLGVGAQPTEAVVAIFKASGDWQKFKGEAAPPPLKVAEPKRPKQDVFNEALTEAHGEAKTEAVTKKAAAKKSAKADKKADKSDEGKADKAEAKAEKADEGKADKAEAKAEKVAEAPADEKVAKYGADAHAPAADGSAPAGFEIKGNEDSMKYHTPSSPWYDKTVAEVWFRTEEAAQKAGFVAAGAAAESAEA